MWPRRSFDTRARTASECTSTPRPGRWSVATASPSGATQRRKPCRPSASSARLSHTLEDDDAELLVLPSLADVAGGFLFIVAILVVAALLV